MKNAARKIPVDKVEWNHIGTGFAKSVYTTGKRLDGDLVIDTDVHSMVDHMRSILMNDLNLGKSERCEIRFKGGNESDVFEKHADAVLAWKHGDNDTKFPIEDEYNLDFDVFDKITQEKLNKDRVLELWLKLNGLVILTFIYMMWKFFSETILIALSVAVRLNCNVVRHDR